MRDHFGGTLLPALLLLLLGICSAARPFERVAGAADTYSQLQTAAAAGLLDGFSLPAGELSRLEVAVLVQRALHAYGASQLQAAPPDLAVEAALTGLSGAFAEELSLLGGAPQLPVLAGGERQLGYLDEVEEETEEEADTDNATYLAELCPDCGEPADEAAEEVAAGIATTLYGYFQIHAAQFSTALIPSGTSTTSDLYLYWGELGVDVASGDATARFSTKWDDGEEDVLLHEAWVRYDNPDNGLFAQAGRLVQPFGNNAYYFPSYPAVNDLGYITASTLAAGVEREDWNFGGYLFNPKVEIGSEEDNLSDFSCVLSAGREADACSDGFRLTAGYLSHLGAHDIRLAGDGPQAVRVGAYNLFGRYDWNANRWHLLADYTAALDEFASADLDANEDSQGDQPAALNCELVYEPQPDSLWGLSYQATEQMADYAENRIGLLWGRRLNELALFKLEYTHGEYGEYATGAQDSDDTLVAEISLSF